MSISSILMRNLVYTLYISDVITDTILENGYFRIGIVMHRRLNPCILEYIGYRIYRLLLMR